jgi:hypothetical protein
VTDFPLADLTLRVTPAVIARAVPELIPQQAVVALAAWFAEHIDADPARFVIRCRYTLERLPDEEAT